MVQISPKPVPEFIHPELGRLTFEDPFWNGTATLENREIRFFLAGTATAPDPELAKRLLYLLPRFKQLEQSALNFIEAQHVEIRSEEFSFDSINLSWEQHPHMHVMEFERSGDTDSIWSVEFENEQPKFLGRDD